MSKGSSIPSEYIYLALFIGLMLFLFLPKNKVCQDDATGDLATRPWFWNCGKGASQISSASTE